MALKFNNKIKLSWDDLETLVDKLCDSGVTLQNSPGVYTAVLHYKPHTSSFKPNIWAEKHKGDEWQIYPWEKLDSIAVQDYLKEEVIYR